MVAEVGTEFLLARRNLWNLNGILSGVAAMLAVVAKLPYLEVVAVGTCWTLASSSLLLSPRRRRLRMAIQVKI